MSKRGKCTHSGYQIFAKIACIRPIFPPFLAWSRTTNGVESFDGSFLTYQVKFRLKIDDRTLDIEKPTHAVPHAGQ